MTGTALLIVLVAAFLHAFWNYLTKRSRNKIVFIWWAILFFKKPSIKKCKVYACAGALGIIAIALFFITCLQKSSDWRSSTNLSYGESAGVLLSERRNLSWLRVQRWNGSGQ